jgi:hypothetical protein
VIPSGACKNEEGKEEAKAKGEQVEGVEEAYVSERDLCTKTV